MPRPVARWVLPVPGGPRKTTFSRGGDEVEGAQVGDGVAFEAAGVLEVEVLQALAGGEPGGSDPAFAAVVLAGGHLTLQAGGQVLLMGPGLGAGALGQPGHRLAQGWGLQRPGQERDLGGHVPGRLGCRGWRAIMPPRPVSRALVRASVIDAEEGVVPGLGPAPARLRLGWGFDQVGAAALQRFGGDQVLEVADRLVRGPQPLVVGDQPARRRWPTPGARSACTSIRRPITDGWTE